MANGNGKASVTVSQSEINNILWKACDTFRGAVDPSEYKNYILVMLFVKYISDVWQDHYAKLVEEYGDPKSKTAKERIERRLKRERFVLPAHCTFSALYEQRNAANIGEVINTALDEIEDSNKEKLEGVFRNIDFNSEASLGQTKERNNRLKSLLEDFSDPKLDLRRAEWGTWMSSATPTSTSLASSRPVLAKRLASSTRRPKSRNSLPGWSIRSG